jgi:hypothetical protein
MLAIAAFFFLACSHGLPGPGHFPPLVLPLLAEGRQV